VLALFASHGVAWSLMRFARSATLLGACVGQKGLSSGQDALVPSRFAAFAVAAAMQSKESRTVKVVRL